MDDLISKKDLLVETGISYGQLYRWKRKNLIPEEWFIKKSSFTGQETFFPKELVLSRINLILNEKDTTDLDTLSEKLSAVVQTDTTFSREELIRKDILKKNTLDLYIEIATKKQFNFKDIFVMNIIEEILQVKNIKFDLVLFTKIIDAIRSNFELFQKENYECIIVESKDNNVFIISKVDSINYSSENILYKSGNLNNKIVLVKSKLE